MIGEGAAFIGEGGFAEGNLAAFGIGEGFRGEGEEAGASEAVEEGIEGAASCGKVGAAADISEKAAGGFGAGGLQVAKDAAEVALLLGSGVGVRLRRRALG